MVTCSDLSQYYYCPRKVYFLKTMEVPVHYRPKMKMGREEEQKERKRLFERKDVFGLDKNEVAEIKFKVYVEDNEIGLCGIVDSLLFLKDGEILPVEIKYTDFVYVRKHWKKQLTAYAILLDNEFKVEVKKGIIYYPEQNKEITVEITDEDKEFLKLDIERIRDLIKSERIPRKASEKKCGYCEVKRYCV